MRRRESSAAEPSKAGFNPTPLGSGDLDRLSFAETAALLAADARAGLSPEEARKRLERWGPNEVAEKKPRLVRMFLKKFLGLTAGMLEFIIILSLLLGHGPDAAVVAGLLLMNSLIGFQQERKAGRVIDSLKTRLRVRARVLRGGIWASAPAGELVPGDFIRVRTGDFVPADIKVREGGLEVDQSALTGESLPAPKGPADILFAGSLIKRGEADGLVVRTGISTRFGKTTELVQIARPRLHMEEVVARLVRWLLLIITALLAVTTAVSLARGFPLLEILPLMLVLLLSAIPVALPVMFTVSTAVGAAELARRDVLITRLSAAEDAATMDVLCVDKTGTLTLNALAVARLVPREGYSEEDVCLLGALASREADQDPLDLAFLAKAKQAGLALGSYSQERFVPFDPAARRTEAEIRRGEETFRVMKGAVAAIAAAVGLDAAETARLEEQAGELSRRGYKTLAVAKIEGQSRSLIGLAALSDQSRPDSKALIAELKSLGISVKMLTGDALPIAREVARDLGIGSNILPASDLKARALRGPEHALALIEKSDGFAEVYPEDKFLIVRGLQAGRHVVGMTGDGVNDAPALKQAEVGIAVNTATDAAKASASVVLTSAGLSGIVELVKNGRKVYQRIRTWVLNKIMRTILKAAFVVGVFLITGDFVVSAFAMVLLLLMTDFVKISLSTDRVRWSRSPDTWEIGGYVKVAAGLGILMVLESLGLLALGLRLNHWAPADPIVRTFAFEILFFSALASIFVIRERGHFWSAAPSRFLAAVMALDALAGGIIATAGIPGALPPLPLPTTALVLGFNILLSLGFNDWAKIILMKRLLPGPKSGGGPGAGSAGGGINAPPGPPPRMPGVRR